MVLLRSFIPPRTAGAPRPTFKLLDDGPSGVDNLDASLTINSTTVTPTYRYKGGDATLDDWNAWDYGENLVESVGAGAAASLNQGSPLLGSNDDSVLSNAVNGSYWQSPSVSDHKIDTEDFVIEGVINVGSFPAAASRFFGTRGSGVGWNVYLGSTGSLILDVQDSGGNTNISAAGMSANTWIHFMIFGNRDEASNNSVKIYVNGAVVGAGGNISTRSGTFDSGLKFVINERADIAGFGSINGKYAYMAMWKQADWHQAGASGPTEWAACAAERFTRLIGLYPQRAKGTALPTTQTRATVAYLDKLEDSGTTRKLYQVGSSWLRVCDRNDSASENIKGYLSELAATNLCLQSEDMGTTWAQIDVGDTIGGSVEVPNKTTNTTAGLIPDATDGPHGVNQDITLTAVTYAFTVFAKKGTHDWLLIDNDTIANGKVWFDLTNGVIGTEQAGIIDAHIDDYGDGWFLCHYIFTGTVAAHSMEIRIADADNTTTASGGDGAAVGLYAWGAQCELGANHTSYIPTTTGTVTRNKDELIFKGDDGNIANTGVGSLACKHLNENYDLAANGYLWALSDGGSAADRVNVNILAAGDTPSLTTAATAGNAGSVTATTDVINGVIHDVRATWKTDSVKLYVDGAAEGTEDTSADMPNDLDEIAIAQDRADGVQLNGLISNLRIFDKTTRKG